MEDAIRVLSEEVAASRPSCLSYFAGALRDGTFSSRHRTWRLAQKTRDWLLVVQLVLERLGAHGWIYREGKDRSVWCLKPASAHLRVERLRGRADPSRQPSLGATSMRRVESHEALLLVSTFNWLRRTDWTSRIYEIGCRISA